MYRCVACGRELREWSTGCLSCDTSYECDNNDCPLEGMSMSQEQARELDSINRNRVGWTMAAYKMEKERDEARQVARRMKRENERVRGITERIEAEMRMQFKERPLVIYMDDGDDHENVWDLICEINHYYPRTDATQ